MHKIMKVSENNSSDNSQILCLSILYTRSKLIQSSHNERAFEAPLVSSVT